MRLCSSVRALFSVETWEDTAGGQDKDRGDPPAATASSTGAHTLAARTREDCWGREPRERTKVEKDTALRTAEEALGRLYSTPRTRCSRDTEYLTWTTHPYGTLVAHSNPYTPNPHTQPRPEDGRVVWTREHEYPPVLVRLAEGEGIIDVALQLCGCCIPPGGLPWHDDDHGYTHNVNRQ
jgi:hypothetical protein